MVLSFDTAPPLLHDPTFHPKDPSSKHIYPSILGVTSEISCNPNDTSTTLVDLKGGVGAATL
jgi:hypothetical protein